MPLWTTLRDSLRWRLLLATAISISLALLLTGWSLQRLFHDHVDRQMAQMLSWQLDQLTAQFDLSPQGEPVVDPSRLSDPRLSRPYAGLYWQIDQLKNGHVLQLGRLRSRSLWDVTLRLPDDGLVAGSLHQHDISGPADQQLMALERVVRLPAAQGSQWRLIVAADMRSIHQAMSAFSGMLTLALGLLCLLLIIAALVQVHVGLAPMRGLRQALQDIQQGRASQLQGRFPQEMQALAADFNLVLQRNAELVARARIQAGNLAHAIKTPLAVMRQTAEQLASSQPGMRDISQRMQEQIDLASRQVQWHLARARAAAAAEVPGHAVEVGPVIDGLLRTMQLVHAERQLSMQWDQANGRLRFAGEKQDLQEMLGNLLDNACKWARHQVTLTVTTRQGQLQCQIRDDGPGIAPEALDAVRQRGVRLDESVPGHGMGLSIVAELAALYRGQLQLEPSPQGGLCATLRLPMIPPTTSAAESPP
ncbi:MULTISPECIES: sensor histidine kinase [unclassified Paludibacterium]|uniref:sensor histidine kinase n=1 Tax=unclassified Paludibacterium TaxID=2618429 RepID=UPI001C04D54F|nr:sensor histidine kinase [Paludibacterium sp. B53371]BEV72647.1 sensor histidine kinase [Paludibacterium sp. THUN1379]